jgi:hypothetical protein
VRPSTSTTVCLPPISPGYPKEPETQSRRRARYEREGVPTSERRHCDAEHPSGTRLPGCLKVYIPDFTGAWRIVFQIALMAEGKLGLEYVALGVAHPPERSRQRSVYELAHYRLHGTWPHRPPR